VIATDLGTITTIQGVGLSVRQPGSFHLFNANIFSPFPYENVYMCNEHWASDPLVLSCHGTGHQSNPTLQIKCCFHFAYSHQPNSPVTTCIITNNSPKPHEPVFHQNPACMETNLLYTLYEMQKPVVTILYTSCYIQLQTNVGDKILYTQSHKSTTKPAEIIPEQAAKPHATSCFRC